MGRGVFVLIADTAATARPSTSAAASKILQ
jgi:hypothetical protein